MLEIKGTQEEIYNIKKVINNYCIDDCNNCFLKDSETCDIDATYKVKAETLSPIEYLGEDVRDGNGKLIMRIRQELSVEEVVGKINEIIEYINKEK